MANEYDVRSASTPELMFMDCLTKEQRRSGRASVGNATLRRLLAEEYQMTPEVYLETKKALIASGTVFPGRGRGGSVSKSFPQA